MIPSVPEMPEQDANQLATDEDSSKESSLQSSLQDTSLTELEEKLFSTGIGSGMSTFELHDKELLKYFFNIFLNSCCFFWIREKLSFGTHFACLMRLSA